MTRLNMCKLKFIILIILLLLPSQSFAWEAGQQWDKPDTYREVTWQVLHFIDWGTTLDIAKNPDKFYEMNPIMGEHPSEGNVNIYMGLSALTHLGISYLLPPKQRAIWQYISIGASGACVVHNFNAGLKVNF